MSDIIDGFLSAVSLFPAEPAVIDGRRQISYYELFELSRRVAGVVEEYAPDPRVAILLPQSVEAYVSIIGTLMAGGCYCPLNVALPALRKRKIIEDFEPHLVISNSVELGSMFGDHMPLPSLNIDQLPDKAGSIVTSGNELAYVIFTSGSTGSPKGVMIRRRAISHFIDWALEATDVSKGDRWGQFSNLGFDLSIMDIFACLGSGATLVPINTPKYRLMPGLAIEQHSLTIWHSVPSVIDLINHAGHISEKHLHTLRLMSFCGEPLLPQHLETLFKANSNLRIFNTYGPTETTLFCTWIELSPENYKDACDITVSIGDPIPGWKLDLLGGPSRVEGEIVISGSYIGAGYWKNPLETGKRYRILNLGGEKRPAFLSGDWAEFVEDHLYFRHRLDNQAKIRGHRIELDEVDFYIREFGVTNSCTILYQDRLYSFLESHVGVDVGTLRSFLSEHLPYYSVPSAFRVVGKLPRNQNEKIDRTQLKLLLSSLNDL